MKFYLCTSKYHYDEPDEELEKLGFKFEKRNGYHINTEHEVCININTLEDLLNLTKHDIEIYAHKEYHDGICILDDRDDD